MKIATTLLVAATFAISALSTHSAQNEKPAGQRAQMQHGSMPRMDDQQMAQMQERMKQMHEQMDRIHKTKDANERQKLMREHMQTMNETMKMMHGMGGGMMMEMMDGNKPGMGAGAKGGHQMDARQRQEMMEKRMDMMQMMMEQMMQHQQMMMPSATGK